LEHKFELETPEVLASRCKVVICSPHVSVRICCKNLLAPGTADGDLVLNSVSSDTGTGAHLRYSRAALCRQLSVICDRVPDVMHQRHWTSSSGLELNIDQLMSSMLGAMPRWPTVIFDIIRCRYHLEVRFLFASMENNPRKIT